MSLVDREIVLKEDFIWPALNAVFADQWEEFWPESAACAVSEGVGVVVTYPSDRFIVAAIVLTDLQISPELLEAITEVNVGLPIGCVFLSGVEGSWCAIWRYKLLTDWLDPGSRVSWRMARDVLTNAPNMTRMAARILQAKACGGRAFTVEPDAELASWAFVTMSHV